ncbi:MAG TPA: ATP-binding protein [Candidatus Saccharimonadia bacterium]
MKADQFRRQTLALFFIVSIVPALVVGAVWYLFTQTSRLNFLFLDFDSFVLPVILVGVIPAVTLSFVFAELLARPVRRIRDAVLELAKGNFSTQFRGHGAGEFHEIGVALDSVATKLQQTISEAASETALIAAERNKLRSVLGAMTDGVFALDHTGRIVLFNKAASELTGRSITEVAGQLAEKMLPFRSNGELVMTRWLANQPGTEHKVGQWKGLELYRADGTSLYVDVQAVVLNDDPNGIATLVTFHDLTKTHQLEEMKVDFVALAAHELRTPITEIKGYLDILNHEAKQLNKANREFLERTIASANQLSGLMHNLLNVSRIERGELGYQPEHLDYRKLVTDVVGDLKLRAKQQHRKLTLELPPLVKSIPISGDPTSLREILTNLVNNAIEHTGPSIGEIKVQVAVNKPNVETSVIDNGTGIPAEAVSHLFTKFFRVGEMKSTTRGTGLGLYICRAMVEAHGGTIWAESTEGEGSTFTFRLPMRTVASVSTADDNKEHNQKITRGAHGWIKDNSIH